MIEKWLFDLLTLMRLSPSSVEEAVKTNEWQPSLFSLISDVIDESSNQPVAGDHVDKGTPKKAKSNSNQSDGAVDDSSDKLTPALKRFSVDVDCASVEASESSEPSEPSSETKATHEANDKRNADDEKTCETNEEVRELFFFFFCKHLSSALGALQPG